MKTATTIYKNSIFVIPIGSKIVFQEQYYIEGWVNKEGVVLNAIIVNALDNFRVRETCVVENYKEDIKGMYKGYWNEQRSKKTR